MMKMMILFITDDDDGDERKHVIVAVERLLPFLNVLFSFIECRHFCLLSRHLGVRD